MLLESNVFVIANRQMCHINAFQWIDLICVTCDLVVSSVQHANLD